MKNRKLSRIMLGILCAVVLIWIVSLIYCEVMTVLHGDMLMQMQNRPTMIAEPEYIKVLKYDRDSAKLYYVERDMLGGHVLYLEKDNGIWSAYRWDTVWSGRGGSASGVVYPYIWHFVYGGL